VVDDCAEWHRVAATSLRSRIGEFIRSGVVGLKARLCDDPNKRTTKTDFRKPEARYSSALMAAVRARRFVGMPAVVAH
jgi:hypothetical protein